jgi:hypothetical protein
MVSIIAINGFVSIIVSLLKTSLVLAFSIVIGSACLTIMTVSLLVITLVISLQCFELLPK